jgi:hypothetical protein
MTPFEHWAVELSLGLTRCCARDPAMAGTYVARIAAQLIRLQKEGLIRLSSDTVNQWQRNSFAFLRSARDVVATGKSSRNSSPAPDSQAAFICSSFIN